jgi:RNA polymerase sigma factor (sigma-70 family)
MENGPMGCEHGKDGVTNDLVNGLSLNPKRLNDLLNHTWSRLQLRASQMLHGFPQVVRDVETGDVLNAAMLKLSHSIQNKPLKCGCHFHNRSAKLMRQELIDLARRKKRRNERPARDFSSSLMNSVVDNHTDPLTLEDWELLHVGAGKLRRDLRRVFDLMYYQGLRSDEVAAILGVSDRTVERKYLSAQDMIPLLASR